MADQIRNRMRFPVPGGPWTTRPSARESLRMISSWSSLKGLGKNTSAGHHLFPCFFPDFRTANSRAQRFPRSLGPRGKAPSRDVLADPNRAALRFRLSGEAGQYPEAQRAGTEDAQIKPIYRSQSAANFEPPQGSRCGRRFGQIAALWVETRTGRRQNRSKLSRANGETPSSSPARWISRRIRSDRLARWRNQVPRTVSNQTQRGKW